MAEENTASGAADALADFLRRRREQIAQRWADAALFRTVFTVARDEAVEASKAVLDALAEVARSGRLEDLAAPGFTAVREQLGRMSASRGRAGFTTAQIDSEVAGLRAPVIALLRAEFDASEEPAHECALALTALMGTLRLVVLETTVSAGEQVIARQHEQLLEVATPVIKLWEAAEMHWQLLPGGGCAREEYVIGAHLEPAYAIGGDNFDWSTGADHLVLTMTDGMGQGIDASLLTSLAVSALRNARRADISLADQVCLADQAVYAQYGGKVYASTLLRFELATGIVCAVDAGSPQLFRQRDGRTEQIELTAQLPLGMFEETLYEEQTFQVRPGDRLIAVSTGVHGTRSAVGDLFGERALRQVLSATRPTTPHETARAIVAGLVEHYGSSDLAADAAVVCLDWNGPRG
ncbi:PP2C family protein-serine/threonine phosphatase [Streptomyces gilvus]|uniref:PP2C family protein-serine/threonine phosphatase n=1 Tax=Streptomyces gilvus TaxID=2920937 RepID=UPI001F0F2916|nr:SpoIIE family protein phosphatase [Streptomyces sp. CME 23]MCH5671109.1 SpoIIE family protein phosphatase [Streptomyces sp. CME 23]